MATLPKKLLATLAAAGLTTGLVACSSDDDGSGGDINTDQIGRASCRERV